MIVYKLVFGFDQTGEHGNLVRDFHHRKRGGKMKPKKHEDNVEADLCALGYIAHKRFNTGPVEYVRWT